MRVAPNKATQSDSCGTVMAKATAVWSAGPQPELLGDKVVSPPCVKPILQGQVGQLVDGKMVFSFARTFNICFNVLTLASFNIL